MENSANKMNMMISAQVKKIEQYEKMTVQLQSEKDYLSLNLMNAQISKEMLEEQNRILVANSRKSEMVEMLKYAYL